MSGLNVDVVIAGENYFADRSCELENLPNSGHAIYFQLDIFSASVSMLHR